MSPRTQGENTTPPSSWQSRVPQPYDALASPSGTAAMPYPAHTQYPSSYEQRRDSWTAHAALQQQEAQRGVAGGSSDGSGPAMVSWSPTGPPLPGQSLASAPAVTFSAASNFPAVRPRDHFRARSYPSMQWHYDQANGQPNSASAQHYHPYSYGFERGTSPGAATSPTSYHRHAGGEGRPSDR